METEGNYLSSYLLIVKGCCTLVKDRFKSLEKRGLVVPTGKTKTKRLVYEFQDCILSSLWFLKCTCIFYISYSNRSLPVSSRLHTVHNSSKEYRSYGLFAWQIMEFANSIIWKNYGYFKLFVPTFLCFLY